MKRCYAYFFLLSAFSLSAQDTSDEQYFQNAYRLQQGGNYQAARALYEKIEDKTVNVYENMKLCAHECGDYGYEHLYQLRAERLKSFPLLYLQLLFLACFVLFLFLRNYLRFFQSQIWVIFTMLFFILFLGFITWKHYEHSRVYGVVIKKSELYSGPDKDFASLHTLKPSDELYIDDVQDGFYKVRGMKSSGWVKSNAIVLL